MVEFVIERFINLLRLFETASTVRRDRKDNALRAVSVAIDATYIYYRDIEKGEERNAEVEAQLSHYWSAAAIPLRHIDDELAEVCEYKSECWVNP